MRGTGSRGPEAGFVFLLAALSGCGGYADFRLPEVARNSPAATYKVTARVEPVMGPGAAGQWDSVDVLNPSVVRRGGAYYNFYSGFDGHTWRTGLATSPDGVQWTRQGMVLEPDPRTWEGDYIAANGSAVAAGDGFLYWYQAGGRERPRIGLARSVDGHAWRKEAAPVLETGPRGSWDERGVADPYVLRVNDSYYLFYLGQDRARRQRLGVARSTDGMHWDKLRANPVLELGGPGAFDENGLGEPAVWIGHGYYWMAYTGRDLKENRRIGLARSRDGVEWRKLADVFAGGAPWDSKVVCDPTVGVLGEGLAVWFGGGDVASPDENLHGRIGVASLEPVLP